MTEVCSCVTTVLIIIIIVCVDIEKKSIMASLFEYEKEAIRIKVKHPFLKTRLFKYLCRLGGLIRAKKNTENSV